jgi:hypothetical protein
LARDIFKLGYLLAIRSMKTSVFSSVFTYHRSIFAVVNDAVNPQKISEKGRRCQFVAGVVVTGKEPQVTNIFKKFHKCCIQVVIRNWGKISS